MILVTGATGQVGSAVVERLHERGLPFRAMVRSVPDAYADRGIDSVTADFGDPAALDAAMAGAQALFLICAVGPQQAANECRAIAAAQRADIRYVLKISGRNADPQSASDFRRWNGIAEAALLATPMTCSILRPTNFHQTLNLPVETANASGKIMNPYGATRITFIDLRDIADAAIALLAEQPDEKRIYELTGPEPVTYPQVANILEELMQKPIACIDESDADTHRRLIDSGMTPDMARSMICHYQANRAAGSDFVSGWTEILSGQPPRTVRAFLEEAVRAGD